MDLFLIILYLATTIVSGIIIINTNSPSKALGYLLLIVLVPIIGIIFYFTLGVNYRNRKIYKKKLEIDKEKYPLFEEKYRALSKHLLQQNKEKLGYFFPLAGNHSLSLFTYSNSIDLLINGEEKFPKLLDDLKAANSFIHLEYYIFENDEIGNSIINILIQKAKEGIKVRMIYDDFGSAGLRKSVINNLRKNGIEVYPFFKIHWLLFANRINYRNHRKIVVIDGIVGYIGGINISAKYSNAYKKNKLYWRDTSVRLTGLAVAQLQYVFLTDWNFCAGQSISFSTELFPYKEETLTNQNHHFAQTVISGPDSDSPAILYAMVQAIYLCKKEILITTPYFIPPPSLIDAIKIASLSGVTVKLLVPGISDSTLINAISNTYFKELLDVGVEIYKYQKGFVHAKTMVCDEEILFVGTTNLDHRSFELNFEIHEIIYDKGTAASLTNAFYTDLKSSTKLNSTEWAKRHRITLFFERMARLLSPLI